VRLKGPTALRVGWLLIAIGTLFTMAILIFGFQTGTCVDYASPADGESKCTSAPSVGIGGALILGVGGIVLAGYASWRAFRLSPSDGRDNAQSLPAS
jgi:hypothetical protein